jgi:ribose 5-phosphate isomerase B
MRVAVGCDHRGVELRGLIVNFLKDLGHTVEDFGVFDTKSVDYPDIAFAVSESVSGLRSEFGILICNTGIGMSIAANKVKGVRAALCHNEIYAQRARQHNDSNVLCIGTMQTDLDNKAIVRTFLNTQFEAGRHLLRLEKIQAREKC